MANPLHLHLKPSADRWVLEEKASQSFVYSFMDEERAVCESKNVVAATGGSLTISHRGRELEILEFPAPGLGPGA